jgi:hypothetical protein
MVLFILKGSGAGGLRFGETLSGGVMLDIRGTINLNYILHNKKLKLFHLFSSSNSLSPRRNKNLPTTFML